MKNALLIIAVIFCGNAYTKTIPGPFWYSISEKILSEAHQFISPETKDTKNLIKVKSLKAKPIKNNLKCQSKKEIILPVPYFTITGNGMWMVNDKAGSDAVSNLR